MSIGPIARYALRPFHGAPLIFVATVSVLLALAGQAGWLGVPLTILLVSWIWTYTYLLVDSTARGLPPPVLAIEMTNPLHEVRPLLPLLLLGAAASFAWWLDARGLRVAAVATAVVMGALLPASLAVIAVEGDLARAVWPPALLRIVHGIGAGYLLVIGVGLLGGAALGALGPHLPRIALAVLAQLAVFALATTLGGALYERRAELGVEAWESPERRARAEAAGAARARDRLAEEVYVLVRARHPERAWDRLVRGLGAAPVDPADYRWLRERAAAWDDRGIADRLTQEIVTRLLALRRRGDALLEVEAWWKRGGAYAPRSTAERDALAGVAAQLGHDATVERLRASADAVAGADAGDGT